MDKQSDTSTHGLDFSTRDNSERVTEPELYEESSDTLSWDSLFIVTRSMIRQQANAVAVDDEVVGTFKDGGMEIDDGDGPMPDTTFIEDDSKSITPNLDENAEPQLTEEEQKIILGDEYVSESSELMELYEENTDFAYNYEQMTERLQTLPFKEPDVYWKPPNALWEPAVTGNHSPVKIGKLVLQSIRKLRQAWSTMGQIKNYMNKNCDVNMAAIDAEIDDYVAFAVGEKIILNHKGKYRIPNVAERKNIDNRPEGTQVADIRPKPKKRRLGFGRE